MLTRLLGPTTNPRTLLQGLNTSSERVKGIAHRIANATNGAGGFGDALENAAGEVAPVDLEQEMVALADEELRYEAASRLLQKVYAQLRSSVRER